MRDYMIALAHYITWEGYRDGILPDMIDSMQYLIDEFPEISGSDLMTAIKIFYK